jgi:hypothetical protein
LRTARAYLRYARAVYSTVRTHRGSREFSQQSWNAILDAHCRTNGRSTDDLLPLLRRLAPVRAPRDAVGLLGRFTVSEQQRIAEQISRDGYYIFETLLPETICGRIEEFARSSPANIFDEFGYKGETAPYDPNNLHGRLYKFAESALAGNSALQQLMGDEVFRRIAESYLQTQVTIGGLDGWWSAPYGNGPSSEAAQMFHFDFDAPPNWLKLFVYVTPVEAETGPHVYVRGSHKGGNRDARHLLARGYQRIPDEDIEQVYGAGSIVEITGKRGTVFLADTRGFHKGKHPTRGDRLLAQIVYCSPVFLDPARRSNRALFPMDENETSVP